MPKHKPRAPRLPAAVRRVVDYFLHLEDQAPLCDFTGCVEDCPDCDEPAHNKLAQDIDATRAWLHARRMP